MTIFKVGAIDTIEDMVKLLRRYLQMPSLDGRLERQELRKQMQELLDKYDSEYVGEEAT